MTSACDAAGAERLTRNERAVLAALRQTPAARSAYDLLDELRDVGLKAPAQVYRALQKLIRLGLAHRIESVNGFVACAHPQDDCFAAFAICTECGAVAEITDETLVEPLSRWARRSAFALDQVTLEARGRCRACATATRRLEETDP